MSILDSFRLNSGLQEMFLVESYPLNELESGGLTVQFKDIGKKRDFYNWAQFVLIPGLFSSVSPLTGTEVLTVRYNQVGGIRVRQVRVQSNSCEVLNYSSGDVYSHSEVACYADYSDALKSTISYSVGLNVCSDVTDDCLMRKAFTYSSYIPNSSTVIGVLADYGTTGFYIDSQTFLGDNVLSESEMSGLFTFLEQNDWIDLQTRAVIITFLTFNANYQYFSQVQFVVEFGAAGVVYPKSSIDTINIIPFMASWTDVGQSFSGFMRKFPELYVFIYSWVGLLLPLVFTLIANYRKFFSVMWNYISLLLFILIQGQIILRVYLYFVAHDINATLQSHNFNVFLNLNTPILAVEVLGELESYSALLAAVKLLSFSKLSSLTMIWDTLERGSRSIFAFMIILALLLNAFTQMSHIVYGSTLQVFSTYFRSLISQYRMLLGDIAQYQNMANAEPYFSPFIFIGYIFLCFFVMLNVFTAILNEALGVVVSREHEEKDIAKIRKFGVKLWEEMRYYWKKTSISLTDCWKKGKQKPMSTALRHLRN